jgi:hypothetical protein
MLLQTHDAMTSQKDHSLSIIPFPITHKLNICDLIKCLKIIQPQRFEMLFWLNYKEPFLTWKGLGYTLIYPEHLNIENYIRFSFHYLAIVLERY